MILIIKESDGFSDFIEKVYDLSEDFISEISIKRFEYIKSKIPDPSIIKYTRCTLNGWIWSRDVSDEEAEAVWKIDSDFYSWFEKIYGNKIKSLDFIEEFK